jgi:DNA-binding SARP family transcriptional activator
VAGGCGDPHVGVLTASVHPCTISRRGAAHRVARRRTRARPALRRRAVSEPVDRLHVDVLGPMRVRDAASGREATPDGPRPRRLLALLVLHRGRSVSTDALVETLWPTNPPRDPTAALHNQVSRLRKALPEGVVVSTGSGYRIDPARVSVDADRLAAAIQALRDDAATSAVVDEILQRWDGPAYPDLDDTDDGRAVAVRLAELRIRARELSADCRLARGETDGLVAEVAALADEEPLRERPRGLLTQALAVTGRRVEALRVYDDFRRLLGDELGIEPSPVLAAQHAALLRTGDPAPAGPRADGPSAADATSVWVPATRLPVPATSLVGRDAFAADLVGAVSQHRLVTVVGPGGVGKTRLLVEIGRRLHDRAPDTPVVLCELATSTAESAVDAVAAALAIEGRPGQGLIDRIPALLADRRVVLLLDNCEHVLDPLAALAERPARHQRVHHREGRDLRLHPGPRPRRARPRHHGQRRHAGGRFAPQRPGPTDRAAHARPLPHPVDRPVRRRAAQPRRAVQRRDVRRRWRSRRPGSPRDRARHVGRHEHRRVPRPLRPGHGHRRPVRARRRDGRAPLPVHTPRCIDHDPC